jgi:integrase
LKTRSVNQEHAIRFIKWARETHHVMSLVQVDPHADELVAEYLQLHISEGKSPYTLQTQRAARRLFFDNRQLAESVPLPRRTGATITRSRGAKAHDRHFQSANWEPLLRFLQATGLRRQERRDLKCRAISRGRDGVLYVHVESGKGGRQREVEVLAEQEGDVLPLSEGGDPNARVFERIPKHLDVHSYRRLFAQARYLHHAPGRRLPPSTGRLNVADYDRDAALKVTESLEHKRLEVVLRHSISKRSPCLV